mmetsp:Transcript_20401/g.61175  ORF Transcript_20401/g.61175 Transcript_20401/m.61175 type:complete len:405 (+) Transcript_20401:118-1332(+)
MVKFYLPSVVRGSFVVKFWTAPAMSATINHEGTDQPLPVEVRERPTAHTSIYKAGQLVYDGAAASDESAAAARAAASMEPGTSLNQMLAWGIANSSPEELERRAAAGATAPSQLDQEVLDMLLGQPAVASMRAALGKLDAEGIAAGAGATEAALAALEELEYYCEDVDLAVDFAKIGGLRAALLVLGAPPAAAEGGADDSTAASADGHLPEMRPPDAELAEAACGVVAAGAQNNPPFQQACIALRTHRALLALLVATGEAAAPVPLQRKALLALSAIARGSAEAAAAVLVQPAALPCFGRLAASGDAKLRRRALQFLLALLRDYALSAEAFRPHVTPAALVAAATPPADAETAAAALHVAIALSGDAAFRRAFAGAGGGALTAAPDEEEVAALLQQLLPRLTSD